MKYDFAIIYEHKARELENACLIKYELERRGYKVLVMHSTGNSRYSVYKPAKAKVLVIPSGSDENTIIFFTQCVTGFKKIISLQSEQILSARSEKESKFYNFSGVGKKFGIVSWGQRNYHRLISNGINEHNVFLTGSVSMDFLRPEFAGYYKDRSEICKQYNIQKDKRICLFISSFAYCGISEDALKRNKLLIGEAAQVMYDISNRTQPVILSWINKILDENEDLIFIYRPHPAEKHLPILEKAKNGNSRFLIISDYSVKQWIEVSDLVYTWNSTSIVEAYFAKKMCYILQPFPFSSYDRAVILEKASVLRTEEDFDRTVLMNVPNNFIFPLSEQVIHDNYENRFGDSVAAYEKVADAFVAVLLHDEYALGSDDRALIRNLSNGKPFIHFKIRFSKLLEKLKLRSADNSDLWREYNDCHYHKEYATEQEICEITNRIKVSLEKTGRR